MMNKYLLSCMMLVLSISLHAQTKSSTPKSSSTNSKYDVISMSPNAIGNKDHKKFSPKPIQFTSQRLSEHGGLRVISRNIDLMPIMISGTPDNVGRSGKDPVSLAKDFLFTAAPIMGIKNSDEEFHLVNHDIDDISMHHLKYQQYYKGIKVYGSEIILHGTEDNIDLLLGRYETTPTLKTEPMITLEEAKEVVISELGPINIPDMDPFGIFDVNPFEIELVIYSNKLAYHSTVYTDLINRYEVFTDAQSGELIKSYKSICQFHHHFSDNLTNDTHECNHHLAAPINETTADAAPNGDEITTATDLLGISRNIHTYSQAGTYYMLDISRADMFNPSSNLPNEGEGIIWTINAFNTSPENNNFNYDHVTSINNNWSSIPAAVSSQYNGTLAYQYFLNSHARVSINGQKGNIVSFINVSEKQGGGMDNAFWNGYAMFYGNGQDAFFPLARGLDVAGHEMTHGVVQNTANLEYYGESGALNESFADVFGALIDRDDWLIGEDVVKTSAFPSGALRSLIDPNQGQPTNSFNTGWQPKHMNQKFNGQEDNNGVHINSGIPNHAFYRFANTVGKDLAERVYYRALDKYLVKSSQFIDARLAVIQAAQDLNLNATQIQAARDAFDAVGILDGNGGDYQEDIEINPGENLIVYASEDLQSLSIMRPDGSIVAENFISVGVKSKPSVSDDGQYILWVNGENQVHLAIIDWDAPTFTFESGILNLPVNENIRNVVTSRKAERVAYSTTDFDNIIYVYDYNEDELFQYELYNPTFSQGNDKTYNVAFSDALEFDYSGDNIMYDARNEVEGVSGTIVYYDIGFLNVWNSDTQSPSLGNISKLFSGLPEGVSVGNPTFSKNSDYIIAFDYGELVDNGNGGLSFDNFEILGANLETGTVNTITPNNTFGYPSYATDDLAIVYTKEFEDNNPNTDFYDIGGYNLNDTKIEATGSEVIVKEEARFATWFSNGERDLVEVIDLGNNTSIDMSISPNPTTNRASLILNGNYTGIGQYIITSINGSIVSKQDIKLNNGQQSLDIPVELLSNGVYNLTLTIDNVSKSTRFVKQ